MVSSGNVWHRQGGFFWKILCSTSITFQKMVGSVHFRVLLFLMFLFWYLFTWNIKGVAAAADGFYGITPWLLPHFFANTTFVIYGEFLLILLNCNAPFLDETNLFTLSRSGTMQWCIGQILFILLSNIFFQLLMFLIEVITLLPYVSFSVNWGSVVYTIAENPMIAYGFSGYGSIDSTIVFRVAPFEAMAAQVVLCVCFGSAVGMIMFFLNGLLKKKIGAVVMTGCVFLGGYLSTLDFYFDLELADNFFFNWLSLADYINGTMDFRENVQFMLTTFLVFAVLSCICVKKWWIQTVQEGAVGKL